MFKVMVMLFYMDVVSYDGNIISLVQLFDFVFKFGVLCFKNFLLNYKNGLVY